MRGVLIAAAGIMITSACAAQEASAVGLRCFPERGGEALLFRLNPMDGTATFASAFGAPAGRSVVSEHEYRLIFPANEARRECRATINRHSGAAEWECGEEPFADLNPKNIFVLLRCQAEDPRPKI